MPTRRPANLQTRTNWLDEISGKGKLQPGNDEPLYRLIADRIKGAIESGSIAPNEKLPTNREVASRLRVDRSTAARAYSELIKEGYLESFVGRGTYARLPGAIVGKGSEDKDGGEGSEGFETIVWNERFSRASQTVYEMFRLERSFYDRQPGSISFAGGIPTDEFYPNEKFVQILQTIIDHERAAEFFEYSPAEGHPALRREVIAYLSRSGMDIADENLLIVSGSQQAIDVVSTVLIDPGDLIACEDPTYLWAICSFRSRQARCLPVSLDSEGLRLDVLETILKRQRPKLIYTIPDFQNPTGLTMSASRRAGLIELATQYQVPILEDSFVSDLRYQGDRIPSLRAMPGGKNIVIHQGTFSKALCPALRLGWLVAPPEVLSRLVIAKRASNLSTNSISQVILAEFLAKGFYEKHLQSVRATYKSRRDTMLASLQKELGNIEEPNGTRCDITWSRPNGGMFIWLRLPEGYSSRELMTFARREGVTYAPGDLCFLSAQNTQFIRLCFIQTDEETIARGVKMLGRAIKTYIQQVISKSEYSRQRVFEGSGHAFI